MEVSGWEETLRRYFRDFEFRVRLQLNRWRGVCRRGHALRQLFIVVDRVVPLSLDIKIKAVPRSRGTACPYTPDPTGVFGYRAAGQIRYANIVTKPRNWTSLFRGVSDDREVLPSEKGENKFEKVSRERTGSNDFRDLRLEQSLKCCSGKPADWQGRAHRSARALPTAAQAFLKDSHDRL